MAKPIYTDDEPIPPPPKVKRVRRKKYPRGKYPRKLTSQSRDVKLLRLPYQRMITLTEAAEIMDIARGSLQKNYIFSKTYGIPDYIEIVRDNNIVVGIKRIGP